MSAPVHAADLPGTDEFIVRCERARAANYCVRAAAEAGLAPAAAAAGVVAFGEARLWFAGARARVHLLTEGSLEQLPAIEAWLQERKLAAMFDVLPIVACRPVVRALGERGYQLVAWQPMLCRALSSPIEEPPSAVEVQEVDGDASDFRDVYLHGYEVPESERAQAATVQEARWRAEGARRFLARIDGEPVAAATLVVIDGLARLANCATLPSERGSGAQAALIRARLRCAAGAGLQLAISDARQGGSSLRNLARAGFGICAHITQWRK